MQKQERRTQFCILNSSFCIPNGVGMPREIITLQCGECKERNYSTTKNRKTTPDRLELKKFCRRCRKHTPHKEVK